MILMYLYFTFFFFNDTATTEIYTLSLHDALPIYLVSSYAPGSQSKNCNQQNHCNDPCSFHFHSPWIDRKSTRLNSSHSQISYAVFCLKKKKAYIDLILSLNLDNVLLFGLLARCYT